MSLHQPGFDELFQYATRVRGIPVNMPGKLVHAKPFLVTQRSQRDQAVDGQRGSVLPVLLLDHPLQKHFVCIHRGQLQYTLLLSVRL